MSTLDDFRGDGTGGGRGSGRGGGAAGKAPRSRLDLSLKQMLVIRAFVGDLLLTFMREKASKLILATLKRESPVLVGPPLKELRADGLWIAEMRGVDGQLAAVHFEFQDRNDRTMPVRMMRYESYIRRTPRAKSAGESGGEGEPAPLGGVLSVVLYTGRAPWTASQYLEHEGGGEPWPEQQPPERYELVDLARSPCDDLDGTSVWAVVQKIFCAESLEEVRVLLPELMRRASAKGGEEGCLAAGELVAELLRPMGMAKELRAAIAEAAKGDGEMQQQEMSLVDHLWGKWTRNLLEKGRAQGAREGERRGRSSMLLRLAERKFGPETAERLAGVAMSGKGPNGLSFALLGDWIIDCETPEELLERLKKGAE